MLNSNRTQAIGETIARLVAIPPLVWAVAFIMFVFQWFLQGWSVDVQVALFIANGYLLLVWALICGLKLRHIRHHLVPHPIAGRAAAGPINDSEAAPLLPPSQDGGDPHLALLQKRHRHLHHPPKVHALPLVQRTAIGRLLFGAHPNRHESLFWFGKPDLMIRLMSALSFATAVYVAIFVFWFGQTVWAAEYPTALALLFYALALLPPILVSVVVIPSLVKVLVLVTKVESLRSKKLIKKTLLDQRTRKTVKVSPLSFWMLPLV